MANPIFRYTIFVTYYQHAFKWINRHPNIRWLQYLHPLPFIVQSEKKFMWVLLLSREIFSFIWNTPLILAGRADFIFDARRPSSDGLRWYNPTKIQSIHPMKVMWILFFHIRKLFLPRSSKYRCSLLLLREVLSGSDRQRVAQPAKMARETIEEA